MLHIGWSYIRNLYTTELHTVTIIGCFTSPDNSDHERGHSGPSENYFCTAEYPLTCPEIFTRGMLCLRCAFASGSRALLKECDRAKPEAVTVVIVIEIGAAFDVTPVCNSSSRKMAHVFLLTPKVCAWLKKGLYMRSMKFLDGVDANLLSSYSES